MTALLFAILSAFGYPLGWLKIIHLGETAQRAQNPRKITME
jgi:hypothetical protein